VNPSRSKLYSRENVLCGPVTYDGESTITSLSKGKSQSEVSVFEAEIAIHK
jgi:hypothetical protein